MIDEVQAREKLLAITKIEKEIEEEGMYEKPEQEYHN